MTQFPSKVQLCGICRFWDNTKGNRIADPNVGLCRKTHPTEIGTGSRPFNSGQWPTTMADDWCGEFEKKEQKQND